MSDLARPSASELLALPDIRRTPAAFKAALRLFTRNWLWGSLTFVLPSGREIPIQGREPGPEAKVIIHDFRFMRRVMAAGDIGFAEGLMAGEWETPDLTAVLISASLNFERLKQVFRGNPLVRLVNFIDHLRHENSRAGSKRNIHAHYDIGNAFYGRWLDTTMTYSSARFERAGQSLDEAQREKYAALARTIGLQSGQSVLEIGCGWGGFAEFAAREVGAKVMGVTISREQYDFARERMYRQGLAEAVDIQLIDYRDVGGKFDRVASIEMFEAVGERYWPAYFHKIHDVLQPGGRAGLQIITIKDELFERYRGRADFIQKYIFPGGMLISEKRLRQETDRAGLSWADISRFGLDYAETLKQWAQRFEAAWPEIKPLGFDERFRRLWRFYLSYCEAGFATGRTNVIQLGLNRA